MAQGKKINENTKIKIVDMHIEGYTYREIAAACKIHQQTVYKLLHNDTYIKDMMKEHQNNYKDEVLDLAIDTVKDALLSDDVPHTIKLGYVQTALKYSGALTEKIEVNKKEEPLNLDELYKQFNI